MKYLILFVIGSAVATLGVHLKSEEMMVVGLLFLLPIGLRIGKFFYDN